MARATGRPGRLVARFVHVEDSSAPLAPGVVAWDARGRIRSLRQARRGERVDDVVVMPGLVNAHAHLQLEPLPSPVADFLPWIGAVMASRASGSPAGFERSAAVAASQLLASGTTAVGEIDSSGSSAGGLRPWRWRGRCYHELIGFNLESRAAAAAVRGLLRRPSAPLRPGLSPHAPYSVSAAAFVAARERGVPLAVHCAELPEEQQLLRRGDGPLRDLLQQLGRLPVGWRPPRCGAVRYLEQLGVLGPRTQLVHCQQLERGDVARIAAAGSPVVVCPGTIEYFGREAPPVPTWLQRGIRVALGTDSRASNNGPLSMRTELARAAQWWPMLSPRQLLRMVTGDGAAALALAGGVGGLSRGGRADCLVVPVRGSFEETLAAFVHGELPLRRVLLGGRDVDLDAGR